MGTRARTRRRRRRRRRGRRRRRRRRRRKKKKEKEEGKRRRKKKKKKEEEKRRRKKKKKRVVDLTLNQRQTLETNIEIPRYHLWLCFPKRKRGTNLQPRTRTCGKNTLTSCGAMKSSWFRKESERNNGFLESPYNWGSCFFLPFKTWFVFSPVFRHQTSKYCKPWKSKNSQSS